MARSIVRIGSGIIGVATLALAVAGPVQAQTGTLSGRVTHAETGQPMATVQISLQGTGLGGLSSQDGTFTLSNVPAGTHTLVGQRIGFQRIERTGVVVTAGGTATVDLRMAPAVLALQGIVAAGLVDPVEGVRSPISVARVGREQIPVSATGSAVSNLQGMVAGLQVASPSGEPGRESMINLRSMTSVMSGSQPLIVVDGVILGAGATNIESADIESMEVVKGASAASLYGSRAAAGVIVITTNRGQGLELGQTRFQLRTEFGRSFMHQGINQNRFHPYLMDEAQTTYVDRNGNPVGRKNRVALAATRQFADKPYPGPTYDNYRAMYTGSPSQTTNFSMMQNGEATNFAITLNRTAEGGLLLNNDGYERSSFRVNLDHRFLDNFSLGISSFHSRDQLDLPKVNFFQVQGAPRDVDVTKRDENGQYVQIPNSDVPYENPLWVESTRDSDRERARTLVNGNLRWEPISWLSFMTNLSYDRQDSETRHYVPKGIPLSVTQVIPSEGALSFNNELEDTWNAETQVSLRRDFGLLNIRTTVRGLLERGDYRRNTASGSEFFVQGLPTLNAAATKGSGSWREQVNSEGYLWDTAFDYDGKYILTGLIRRDGSSLFGADNRWHNYYRVAGAYRLGEEEWFNVPNVDEFKLTVARGTAGGRPRFNNQYETWAVGEQGVSKGNLGNRNLRPEHTTETEASLEMILFGRFGIDLTQSWQRTSEQLVLANVPNHTGFGFQWSNGGAVEGNTTELTLEAQLVQTPRFGWTSTFVFDRSDATMVEWPFPCLRPGHRVWCPGENLFAVYGTRFVDNLEALAPDFPTESKTYPNSPHHGGKAWDRRDEFMINDEGWLVWVGQGNHYTEGFDKNLWGTTTNIAGINYEWGIPMWWLTDAGAPRREQFGQNNRLNMGWANALRLGRNLNLHAHWLAVVGQVIVDHSFTRMPELGNPKHDQGTKPNELKKPARAHFGIDGPGGHYHKQQADMLKLRSLSLNYAFSSQQLARFGLAGLGMQGVTLGIVGRDLINLTNCACPNAEQSLRFTNDDRNNELTNPMGGQRNWGTDVAGYPAGGSVNVEIGVTF